MLFAPEVIYKYVNADGAYQMRLEEICAKKERTEKEERAVRAYLALQQLHKCETDGLIELPSPANEGGDESKFVELFGFSLFASWDFYITESPDGGFEFTKDLWDRLVERMDALLIESQ